MTYLVLARKYRPATFAEVVGQEHITDLLQKGVAADRLTHAFLFTGPRGIGKTSCARILAKSLNCEKGPTTKPCGVCSACKEIAQGTSFDVLEIDGASNRGIDEIRTLRENVKFAPTNGRYKIYIVDEVHMLTTEAFNALLKTLEEPPAHVKFIFATTDPNKVPATIISRCQRYDFKRVTVKAAVEFLSAICKKENLDVEEEALYAIAKAAQGSFRDALSILDQLGAVKERKVKGEDICAMLGLVEMDMLFDLAGALSEKNCANVLKIFDEIIERGKDIKQLARDLVEHFRNLMVIKIGGKTLGKLVDYPVAVKELYLEQSKKFSLEDILLALDYFIKAQDLARVTESLRTPLEIAFARLTYTGGGAAPAVKNVDSAVAKPRPAQSPATPRPAAPATSVKPNKSVSPLKTERAEIKVPAPAPTLMPAAKPTVQQETAVAVEDNEIPDPEIVGGTDTPVDLERLRKSWDALTYGVSRIKMSIATYLQEGVPVDFKNGMLTIGFTPALEFHKETLEHKENVLLVEKIFGEKLRAKIRVQYALVDKMDAPQQVPDEPLIRSALETFQGKVVSQWHNEAGG